jgi:hypothetical protein
MLSFPYLDSITPSMEFIFYKSYVTLELTVCMHTCHLCTYDERWYWRLDFGSMLTILFPCYVCNGLHLIDGYDH